MLEITGIDILKLSDSDLRDLVTRLCLAELRKGGHPRSSVTAGGNQDAADGGIDVRVECLTDIKEPDFVPRRDTGFQVKKPDMPRKAILKEMRPKGVLRDVIQELAKLGGAYVIVTAQGTVADKPLAARRKAMRDALADLDLGSQLHTDFFDRDRLAIWANEYPGVAVWLRGRVGRRLSGWSSVDDWESYSASDPKPYLLNDKPRLIDERTQERKHLSMGDGIARLRAGLRKPGQCIRLIGMSGLGKTRLIQALFEDSVGDDPLDSSLAVYTDYSQETVPTARDMARELIAQKQRAVLVVDNCNPATHSELARLCSVEGSEVSLITIEYDVRDDEPEKTDVFRLKSESPELVTEWIKQTFPEVSQLDREKISEFSDGNFRIARALAETLGRGETLGRLKSNDLFERIFHQRNVPSQQLLYDAQDLSLLYSIDGEDESEEGELAKVGAIRGVGAIQLYEALSEVYKRDIGQSRGRFRAVLPQAIANRLAASALERISPARFDKFCGTLTPRMLKSVSRRLGLLHDSSEAQSTVARWLQSNGPVGDLIALGDEGFKVITNIAPVLPNAVLVKLEDALSCADGGLFQVGNGSQQWIRLTKAIGYDPELFNRAAMLLARNIKGAKKNNNAHSEINVFSEFFHLHLSGTLAPPEQRRALIRCLAASGDSELERCAQIALRALMKSGHFMSMDRYYFGARSRGWGWQPKINKDIWDWYEEAINLAVEILPELDSRKLLADGLRGLWRYPGCRRAITEAAVVFIQKQPWIEGWIAGRATLRFDKKEMPEDAITSLEQLINHLKPTDLLSRARAVVMNRLSDGGGWDFADGEDDDTVAIKAWEKAGSMAQEIGCELASENAIREVFIKELLVTSDPSRSHECGRGLAEGALDYKVIWSELVTAYSTSPAEVRNKTALGGFIAEAYQRNPQFASDLLEDSIENNNLLPILPYLQAQAGVDEEGVLRLRRAVSKGGMEASNFHNIANGCVSDSPPELLAELLEDIAALPDGINVALDILRMRFLTNKNEQSSKNARLISVGRDFLARVELSKDRSLRDHTAGEVISICLPGKDGRNTAKKLCGVIRTRLEDYTRSGYDLCHTLEELFKAQPFIALDTFLLPNVTTSLDGLFDENSSWISPIEALGVTILQEWANQDPNQRYPLLGKCIQMFSKNGEAGADLSSLFLSLLGDAPDKKLFLGGWEERFHPGGWSGSLADILVQRKEKVMGLAEVAGIEVSAWVADAFPELDRMIAQERGRDRAGEESFE